MSVLTNPSPNFDERTGGALPSFIILHYTGMKTAADALVRLCDPSAKVSAHYTVDETGDVYSHVREHHRAWHAGQSFWRGVTDMNSHSIGIEIVNPGHEWGYRTYPDAQIQAVSDLCLSIMGRHHILPENILAHSDIAPDRKQDPGEFFPWKILAEQGVGAWPFEGVGCTEGADIVDLDHALIEFGYDPAVTAEERLLAFQRHFEPEAFATMRCGQVGEKTCARLRALRDGDWLRPKRAV
jgi:N-acetylmuramoyl-L-alanine amidase